jgi:hypothetical protein
VISGGGGFGLNAQTANVLDYLFAENIRIAFTALLGKGNDLVGDGFLDIVGTVADPQSDARKFECAPRTRVVSRSNFSPLRNGRIGIARQFTGGSATSLSVIGMPRSGSVPDNGQA